MRFEVGIADQFAGTNAGAVDHEIEFRIDLFEFLEENIRIDCTARFQKTRSEIIEIDRSVH